MDKERIAAMASAAPKPGYRHGESAR